MSHIRTLVVALLAISCLFSVNAQITTTSSCQSLSGMTNINASLLIGKWYEEFRAPAKNVSCVHINVHPADNQQQLNVTIMYSPSATGILMNQTASAVIDTYAVNSTTGFNIKYNNSDNVTTFKIIDTDYISKIVLCGYTNFNDPSTSYGIIATRKQIVDASWLMQVKNNASQTFSLFNDTQAGNITQSLKCRTNSAASRVPTFAILFTTFYTLVKLVY